ncbi:MAG: NADH-quinone oxidoreductase subunit NuoI [Acidimicrobiia bacterium]
MGKFSGLKVTLRHLFRRPVTTQYPEEQRVRPQRFHGRHVLNRYPDGMEKCIGCELCAGVCPARCIYVRGAENPPDAPISPGERYGYVYEINMLRCIFCGLCVEACPTEAITMSNLFEFKIYDRKDAIYTKEDLLVGEDGMPRLKEGVEPEWAIQALTETGGWMRATSPAGNADFEGIPMWSEEKLFGLRPAERGQRREKSDLGIDSENG